MRSKNSSFFSIKSNIIFSLVLVAVISFSLGTRFDEIKAKVLHQSSKQNSSLPSELDYSSVSELYQILKSKFDGELSEEKLLDGLKHGLAEASGDPYTVFLNQDEAKEFSNELNGEFTGIGAELGKRNDQIVIIAPLDGYPAQKADLRPNDAIIGINGEATVGMSIEEAVSKIRGEKGTDVTLNIQRAGNRFDVTITRDVIVVPSVRHEIISGKIGYLRITRFAEDTTSLASKAVSDMKSQGVNSIILDLRNNGGGYLEGAVDIAGLWLNNKVVVEQRQGDKVTDTLKSGNSAPLEGVNTVVLINEGTASASEIVAGALQDYGAAKLVGVTSFGKGSVQSLESLSNGGKLKVTIARWFTPNGRNIDDEGIKPDTEVKLEEKDYEADRDPQKDKAIEMLGTSN